MSKAKDADEEEVFEIIDFTTASEWERFTASLEEILHDWQLTGSEPKEFQKDLKPNKGEWQEQSASLKFADVPFLLTHHFKTYETTAEDVKTNLNRDQSNDDEIVFPQFIHDILDFENDFPGRAHCLVRWYGLQNFMTLSPLNPLQYVTYGNKSKILLSSLSMAANNTNCCIPMFVQSMNPSDKVYSGIAYGDGLRTDFDMAYIKVPPAQCTHLSGILDVFKSKIGISLSSEPVLVAVRFTYILSEWPHALWTQQPPDFDAALSDVGFSELGSLPFGALSDPICELQLSTTWPCFSEYAVVDTEVQSDLRPSSAPIWSARLSSSPLPPCLLSEYLTEFLHICSDNQSIVQILGHDFDPSLDDSVNIINALDRLTSSPVPSLSSVISRGYSKVVERKIQGPLSEDILSLLLNFLFPDDAQNLQEENAQYPELSKLSQVPLWTPAAETFPDEHPLKVVLGSLKTCHVDSFVWRLAIAICHVVHSFGGIPAVAHLYYELLRELRFHWDNGILIPGLTKGVPDMAMCLIYQKLQMLNCCVTHKNEREQASSDTSKLDGTADEDDEFFECDEECHDSSSSGKEYFSSWDKPEGRLKIYEDLRLLKRKDFIYIPITQEASPFTEDKLDEQTDELLRLGNDSSGSSQRARIMSSSLLSDMESFKAANPGSVLEDFVRWYSPRDWIEEEVTTKSGDKTIQKGLSARMRIPGNLWQEVWNDANPVPARRQKRLFDDTREAEKVLQWFNLLSPGDLCQHLLPVVLHASLCRLADEPVLYTLPAAITEALPHPLHIDSLAAQLELLSRRGVRLCRQPPSVPNYSSLFDQIGVIERCIARAQSLRLKLLGHSNISPGSFKSITSGTLPEDNNEPETESSNSSTEVPPLERLVLQLLQQPDVTLEDGPKGVQAVAIKKLFAEAKDAMFVEEPPTVVEKEQTIRRPEKWDYRNSETSRDIELGKPAGREYLVRAHAAFPADYSRVMPHRLYAVILKNSFRMAGAITQDTLFC